MKFDISPARDILTPMLRLFTVVSLLVCGALAQSVGPAPQNLPPSPQPLMVGGQYNANPAPVTSGNQTPLQLDPIGNLKVNVQAGAITGGGTFAVDSTVFSAGSSSFTPGGAVFQDNLGPISANVWAAFRMTAFRAQHMNLRDASGNEYNALNPLPVVLANATTALGAQVVPVTIQTPPAQSLNVNIAQIQGDSIATGNALPVILVTPTQGLPLQPCNPVRVTNCQHF